MPALRVLALHSCFVQVIADAVLVNMDGSPVSPVSFWKAEWLGLQGVPSRALRIGLKQASGFDGVQEQPEY